MNRWILQMGFPVVTINTQTGNIVQQHFLLDSESVVDRHSMFKYGSSYSWFRSISWLNVEHVILNSCVLFVCCLFSFLHVAGWFGLKLRVVHPHHLDQDWSSRTAVLASQQRGWKLLPARVKVMSTMWECMFMFDLHSNSYKCRHGSWCKWVVAGQHKHEGLLQSQLWCWQLGAATCQVELQPPGANIYITNAFREHSLKVMSAF